MTRLWNRYKAGKVLGHLNVRWCDACGAWHHRLYHAREVSPNDGSKA